MSSADIRPARCQLVGDRKLPADAGSGDEICAVIERVAATLAPSASYSVEVRVLSPSSMAATVRLATGQTLPEQKMAISDRKLNRGSIQRFARAIGTQIAQASQSSRSKE